MATLSEIQLFSGIPFNRLKSLERFGLEFEDDRFEIDAHHRKAIYEIKNKRLSPYFLAYAWRCKNNYHHDDFDRYDNLNDLARLKGLSVSEALADVLPKRIEDEAFAAAKYWLDRCCEKKADLTALKRLASWAKSVIAAAPLPVDYSYLAVRALHSLPYETMIKYPRLIQKAFNRAKHYGFLDGWHRVTTSDDGKRKTTYFCAKFDL